MVVNAYKGTVHLKPLRPCWWLEFKSLGPEGEKHKVKLNPLESLSSLCVKVKLGV
jgi:hypothetical protein